MISIRSTRLVFQNLLNMTVAMTEAAITQIPLSAVRIMIKKAVQRLKTDRRTTKIMTKDRHAPVRKSANMYRDAVWMMLIMSVSSAGS